MKMTDQQRTGRAERRPRPAVGAVLLAAVLTGAAGLAGCSPDSAGGASADQQASSTPDQLSADPLTAVRGTADITGRAARRTPPPSW